MGRVVSTERWAYVSVNVLGVVLPSGNTTYQTTVNSTGGYLFGDTNGDGIVDIRDLQVIANHWQQSDPLSADTNLKKEAFGDLDHNGVVNIVDLQLVANNWQQVSGRVRLFTLSSTHYDAYGRVSSTTDASGQTTSYQYDAMGRQTAVIQPAITVDNHSSNTSDPTTLRVTPTTNYEYDSLGRQTATIAPWIWTKDSSGNWQKTRCVPKRSTMSSAKSPAF